ncbi:MAG: TatD family hydrolase [Magnetococcales bacterium]|nr:TatD family hydrolase [Magnetococcales bacterium]NGZ28155.1 TatD family hydrolase [Magnetococcales bacterium]
MIDTHCHLDFPVFDADRQQVLERSVQAGVDQWVVPGVKLEDFQRIVDVKNKNISIAFGLHPWFVEEQPQDALNQLAGWIERHSPLAIGEIGLDFMLPAATFPLQESLFVEQLRLSDHFRLPVLLHVRRAHDAALHLLKKVKPAAGGIVHAYSGSLQQAYGYLDLGFKLGFGGVVTHTNARRIRQVAKVVPQEGLVLETDAPDLPPTGWQGRRNEPANLLLIAQVLAQLRGGEVQEIVEITTHNACSILRLKEAVG